MKKCVFCAIIIGVVAFLTGTVIGNIQGRRSNFTYYKASILAKHVDYFATELVGGLYARAEEKYSNKDYVGALEDVENFYTVLELEIADPEFKNENAKRREKDVSCVKRLIELNKKIEKEPKNYKLFLERADINAHSRLSMFTSMEDSFCSDWEGAYQDYSKAIELNPNIKEAYEKRADALGWTIDGVSFPIQETKKYEAIFNDKMQRNIADYQKAIELNGRKPELLLRLAGTYNSLNHPENALPLLEEALQMGEETAFYSLAHTYEKLNQPEKVIEYIDKFLEIKNVCSEAKDCNCQNNRHLYYVRAKAAFKLHRYKEGFNDLKKAHYMFLHD